MVIKSHSILIKSREIMTKGTSNFFPAIDSKFNSCHAPNSGQFCSGSSINGVTKMGGTGPLAGMERDASLSGDYLDLQYTKKIPASPNHPEYEVTDLKVGFPFLRAKVKGDTLEVMAIGAGNTKRSGIGKAMVKDAMGLTGTSKLTTSGVESADGRAFFDKLASSGEFNIVR